QVPAQQRLHQFTVEHADPISLDEDFFTPQLLEKELEGWLQAVVFLNRLIELSRSEQQGHQRGKELLSLGGHLVGQKLPKAAAHDRAAWVISEHRRRPIRRQVRVASPQILKRTSKPFAVLCWENVRVLQGQHEL